MHCTLAASQSAGRRDVYEVVRRVYNSVRPSGWTRVMPFEEWTSMSDICDFIFCRCAKLWARLEACARLSRRSLSLRATPRARPALALEKPVRR